MIRALTILVLCVMSAVVEAREADGTLGLLITPNNGVPVITAGEDFSVLTRAESALALVGEAGQRYALKVEWSFMVGEKVQGRVSLPANCPGGVYALEATAGTVTDRNARSVWVVASYPPQYRIAHVSDTHIGKEREGHLPSVVVNEQIRDAVNASAASFVLITGDLTEQGEGQQFQEFITVLDGYTKPTFVTPGNHDRKDLNYEAYFGPLQYRFDFGEDAYLAFDTKDMMTADSLGAQDGFLQLERRAMKAARWSIGFSHRYEPVMGMRSQMALFIDNPLHYLLFGHWHQENTAEQKTVPWGTTIISVVPAAVNGAWRPIDVGVQGLLFHPVESVVPVANVLPAEVEAAE